MFNEWMMKIKDFLDNTPDDIFDFSGDLEDALVDDYDVMFAEQPEATRYMAEYMPDICASAEPAMKPEEIEEFKRLLKIEYEKTLKFIK